jgi:hypothetical protein
MPLYFLPPLSLRRTEIDTHQQYWICDLQSIDAALRAAKSATQAVQQ